MTNSVSAQTYNLDDLSKWDSFPQGNLELTAIPDTDATNGEAIKITTLVSTAQWYNGGMQSVEEGDKPVQAVAGNTYKVNFRYRADQPRKMWLGVKTREKGTYGSKDIAYYNAFVPDATTKYQDFTFTFKPEALASASTVHLQFFAGGNDAGLYIDGITITETSPKPEACNEGPFNNIALWESYGGVSVNAVTDAAATCGNAIELVPTEAKPQWYGAAFRTKLNTSIADEAGEKYRIGFRYRSLVPRRIAVNVTSNRLADRSSLGTYQFSFLEATPEYKNYAITFTSLTTATSPAAIVSLVIGLGDAADKVYIDEVVIEKMAKARTVPTTVYVNPAIGSDSNNGLANTSSGAWKTLSYALTAILPGDTLLLADGVYMEGPLTLNGVVATPEKPTVIKSINKWGAKLRGNFKFGAILSIKDCEYVIVDGIEAFNPDTGNDVQRNVGVNVLGSDYVTVQNVFAHDCGCAGISAREGDYITIQDNIVRDNAKISPYNCSGISVYQPIQKDNLPGYHIIIRRNVAFENECRIPFTPRGFTKPTDGNGIILDDFYQTQSTGVSPFKAASLVENNLTFNNGGNGIKIYEAEQVTVRNNTAWHNNYVLSEGGDFWGEITFQKLYGQNDLINNILVQKSGQPGNGFTSFSAAAGMSLAYQNNLIVGVARIDNPNFSVMGGNKIVSVDRQSYPAFGEATTAVVFNDIDDFKNYFGLREISPGINAGLDEKAAAVDLNGTARPVGPTSDMGAYEGIVAGNGPLPKDELLVATIPSTAVAIKLDGIKEGFYTGLPKVPTRVLINELDSEGDLGAVWTAVWDENNLYVHVQVEDDITGNGNADAVSLFIDGNNAKGNTYDGDDKRFTIHYNGSVSAAFSGSILATAEGYRAEMAIPWSLINVTPSDSLRIGLDLIVNDDDNADGTLDHQLAWQSGSEGAETNPSLFGEALLVQVPLPPFIAAATNKVVIDGMQESSWKDVEAYKIAKKVQPTVTDDANLSATWRAQWDQENLYFFVNVTDDDKQNDSPNWYDDDGIEIYLDADNSKDGDYGSNDYQIVVEYMGAGIYDTKKNLGAGAIAKVTDTDTGYNVEIALPWTALKATPQLGLFLGLDVHVIDDDAGGDRNGKLAWFTNVDNSYRNTTLFGSAVLMPEKGLTLPGKIEAEAFSNHDNSSVIVPSLDEDSTGAVSFLEKNSFTEYSVAINQTGNYTFTYRVHTTDNASFDVQLDTIQLHHVKVKRLKKNDSGWQEVTAMANLPKGNHTLKIINKNNGPVNINWFKATLAGESGGVTAVSYTKEAMITDDNLKIYPNPTSGLIKINLPDVENPSITIYNMNGEIVMENVKTTNGYEVDISHMPNGLYMIQVKTARQYVRRLFIKN